MNNCLRDMLDAGDAEFSKKLEELNKYAFVNYQLLSRHAIPTTTLNVEHRTINRTASIILALLLDPSLHSKLILDDIILHLIDAGFSRWRLPDASYNFLPAEQEYITLSIMSVAQLYGSSISILR